MLISKFDTTNVEENIKEFEGKYNFTFPDQYKYFLLEYNGGLTPKTNFKINKVSSDIEGLYGFCLENKSYNYNKFEKIISFENWLNDYVLPIGENSFGDYIMIGVGQENKGKVYFYYHDRPKKYIELTDDFITFVSKCKSKKIGHIKSVQERKEMLIKNGKEKNITDGWIKIWQVEIDKYANIHQEELILP
ncbi:MAG: SMI1/KNR4 family protein [Eubacteriales bacterium]